ncbi:MAG: oligopeptide/dipeptide ABC transporter ATP-binding protein, partial [Dehalococcoidia bacterium]
TEQQADERTAELFGSVGLPNPARIGRRFPHELSGGQQQRVVIAMALACDPDLLLLDEPTTGLDVTTEATILDLVADLKTRVNAGIIFVSHNLGVIARVADRVVVMYGGQTIEDAPVRETFKTPQHPYTAGLLNCVPAPVTHEGAIPRLRSIPGTVFPASESTPQACLFVDRCPLAQDRCREEMPVLTRYGEALHPARCFFSEDVDGDIWGEPERRVRRPKPVDQAPLLEVEGLHQYYGKPRKKWIFFGPPARRPVRAAVDLHFEVGHGRTVGIVGESGCGKSTVARAVTGLEARTAGDVRLDGESLAPKVSERTAEQKAKVRMVFQNPYASLNPQLAIGHGLIRSIRRSRHVPRREASRIAGALLEALGLERIHLRRRPG